jgi:hypothetical protein
VAGESDKEVLGRRLEEVRQEIASTSERLQQLKDEEYGLTLSLARITGGPRPRRSPAGNKGKGPLTAGGRARLTPLVRDLLSRSTTPLTRAELRDKLPPNVGDVSLDAISASLSYLRGQGLAANVAGAWVAVSEKD